MNEFQVKKSSGDIVPFSIEKLELSLFRAGASPDLSQHIIKKITDDYVEGITTRNIHNKAFHMLRNASYSYAAKYKMKQAILELGPSGYPFEEYISYLLQYQGFTTEVGLIMNGNCVRHEVDVYAKNEEKEIIIECKHHRTYSYKSDIKVALYVHARSLDIINQLKEVNPDKKYRTWLVTNTRFSKDAIAYGKCQDMYLLSWDYPINGNLPDRIALSGLYPISCLCSLTKKEKQLLLDKEIVLCRQILENPDLLIDINNRKHNKVLQECKELVGDISNEIQLKD
jgi:ATP cone domain-containing protein/restriction endonuclease